MALILIIVVPLALLFGFGVLCLQDLVLHDFKQVGLGQTGFEHYLFK